MSAEKEKTTYQDLPTDGFLGTFSLLGGYLIYGSGLPRSTPALRLDSRANPYSVDASGRPERCAKPISRKFPVAHQRIELARLDRPQFLGVSAPTCLETTVGHLADLADLNGRMEVFFHDLPLEWDM